MLKHLKVILFSAFMVAGAGLYSLAGAASVDTFQVSFNCNRTLGVVVSTDNTTTEGYEPVINFGNVNTSAQVIASTPIFISNTSNATSASIQGYSIYVSTLATSVTYGGVMALSGSWIGADADTFAVGAVFKVPGSTPTVADFAPGQGGIVINQTIMAWNNSRWMPVSTGAYPAVKGTAPNYTYVDATRCWHPRGDNSLRMWLGLNTPTAVSDTAAQRVGITVIAY
jgi:hypothetical protein